jgi:hypothetical protein
VTRGGLVGTNAGQSKETSPNLDQEWPDFSGMDTGTVIVSARNRTMLLLSEMYYKFFAQNA